MLTRTLSEMTADDAANIIRRKAATTWERDLNAQAVRVLAWDGESLSAIERAAGRRLDADELRAFTEMRASLGYDD